MLFDGFFLLEFYTFFSSFSHLQNKQHQDTLIVFSLLSLYDKCMHSVCEQFLNQDTQNMQRKLAPDKETESECSFHVPRQFGPTCWRSAHNVGNNVCTRII